MNRIINESWTSSRIKCIHDQSINAYCIQCENEVKHLELYKNQKFPCDCASCGAELNQFGMPKYKFENKEPKQMTRNEAVIKIIKEKEVIADEAVKILDCLESLGLLKFEEEREKIFKIFELRDMINYETNVKSNNEITKTYGVIRLEEWTEGLVLWVGGEIRWKSWER